MTKRAPIKLDYSIASYLYEADGTRKDNPPSPDRPIFSLGELVTWELIGSVVPIRKIGRVVALVPPSSHPRSSARVTWIDAATVKPAQYALEGVTRLTWSYVVETPATHRHKARYYWPMARKLERHVQHVNTPKRATERMRRSR